VSSCTGAQVGPVTNSSTRAPELVDAARARGPASDGQRAHRSLAAAGAVVGAERAGTNKVVVGAAGVRDPGVVAGDDAGSDPGEAGLEPSGAAAEVAVPARCVVPDGAAAAARSGCGDATETGDAPPGGKVVAG
jgi:hypothetical protein